MTGPGPIDEALLALSLDEIEETSGELHRRIASALRALGEEDADRTVQRQRSPRWEVASLLAETELAAATLAAAATAGDAPFPRLDRQVTTIAALMYAAPTLPALLSRLEQDRRLLTSLARNMDTDLDEPRQTPWGQTSIHDVIVTVAILDPARCALMIERAAETAADRPLHSETA